MGATLYIVLHAFASGGAAVTGVEAISNGVPGVPRAVVEERPHHARDHGLHARRDVPRPLGAGRALHAAPYLNGTPTVISQIGRLGLRQWGAMGDDPLLRAAGGHDAHPGARREHQLRRLPPARELPRRRQLHAPPAHQARAPPGVLERDHLPRGRVDRGVDRHQRQGRPPHPALRDRRVHQLHAVPGRHGEAPPHPPRAALALRTRGQRRRRGAVAARRRHHRHHQVHARRVVHHRARPDHGRRHSCA